MGQQPTTYGSTPPQSSRIGQPTPSSAVVLQAYSNTGSNQFPGVAFPGQLAIDADDNTLKFYDSNGAWQGVPGSAAYQTWVQSTAPASGMNEGDIWINPSNDNQVSYYNGSAWTLTPFGTNAIANTITGKTIQTAISGLRMWMTAQTGTSFEGLNLSTGLASETNPANASLNWDTPLTGPPDNTTTAASLVLQSPDFGTSQGSIVLTSPVTGMGGLALASLDADQVWVNAPLRLSLAGLLINGIDFGTTSTFPSVANGSAYTQNISFNVNFPSNPIVICSSNAPRMTCSPTGISTTGFTFNASNWSGTGTASGGHGFWIAIG